jgi:hypothetical protein
VNVCGRVVARVDDDDVFSDASDFRHWSRISYRGWISTGHEGVAAVTDDPAGECYNVVVT